MIRRFKIIAQIFRQHGTSSGTGKWDKIENLNRPTHICSSSGIANEERNEGQMECRLKWKGKTLKLLEKNIEKYFYILRVRQHFSKHIKQGKRENKNCY